MPEYKYKDAAASAYDANKKRLRAEANIVMADALNEAIEDMTHEFNSSLHNGVILELESHQAIRNRLSKAFKCVL